MSKIFIVFMFVSSLAFSQGTLSSVLGKHRVSSFRIVSEEFDGLLKLDLQRKNGFIANNNTGSIRQFTIIQENPPRKYGSLLNYSFDLLYNRKTKTIYFAFEEDFLFFNEDRITNTEEAVYLVPVLNKPQ